MALQLHEEGGEYSKTGQKLATETRLIKVAQCELGCSVHSITVRPRWGKTGKIASKMGKPFCGRLQYLRFEYLNVAGSRRENPEPSRVRSILGLRWVGYCRYYPWDYSNLH